MQPAPRVSPSASPPLLPYQPRLSSPLTSSSPTSPAASPVLITVHISHTGSSQPLSLSASLPVSALQAALSQLLRVHPSEQLLLSKTGVALLPSSPLASYAAPAAAETEEKGASELRLSVWLYERQLLSASGLSPPSLPVPPHYPLSASSLSFSLPPAPPSPSPSSLPHLQSCSSLLLRALPEYVRLFSLHELHAQAYIEHIDTLSKKALQAIAALSSLSVSLQPLALHLASSLSALASLLSSLSSQCGSLSLRTTSALSSLPAALASLPSPVRDALDHESIKSKALLVSRERDRMESRLDAVSARKHQLQEALEDLRRDASGSRWEEERRVMERWTAELRQQCVTWLTDIIAHRDDAFAFVHRVDAALGASHTPDLLQLERDSRSKLSQLEDWNRRDREDRVEHLRSLLLTFQTTAASLLPPAVLSPFSSSLLTASHVLHGVTEEEAALVLVQEYCSRWQDGVLMLERAGRAGESWVRGVEETLRRRRRWRRRRREVEDVVQGWKQEEQEERQRRAVFWSAFGVNLPPQLLKGLKEEGGWLRVELRDEERQLPTVTDDDIRTARERKAATEERKEETTIATDTPAGQHGSEGEEETMTERLLRLTQENRQLKAQLQQPVTAPPPVLPPAAITALQDEVSRLRAQLQTVSSPSSPSSSSPLVPRLLYDDALKNSASLEQQLASAQHELDAAREQLTGQEAHLGWLSTRLQTAVKAEREAARRATAAEEEVTEWKGRAYERVAVTDLAINDMVMAVADQRPPQAAKFVCNPASSSDAASPLPSPSPSSPPIYRVRNMENRQIFLSSDSVNALRERATVAAATSSPAGYTALPDWVVGHIVLIDCRRAGSRAGRDAAVPGVKEGDEYWLVTVELIDWSLRTKGREEKEERKRGKEKEDAAQTAEAEGDSRAVVLAATAAAAYGTSGSRQQQSPQPTTTPSPSSNRSSSAVQQLDAIILASP